MVHPVRSPSSSRIVMVLVSYTPYPLLPVTLLELHGEKQAGHGRLLKHWQTTLLTCDWLVAVTFLETRLTISMIYLSLLLPERVLELHYNMLPDLCYRQRSGRQNAKRRTQIVKHLFSFWLNWRPWTPKPHQPSLIRSRRASRPNIN